MASENMNMITRVLLREAMKTLENEALPQLEDFLYELKEANREIQASEPGRISRNERLQGALNVAISGVKNRIVSIKTHIINAYGEENN